MWEEHVCVCVCVCVGVIDTGERTEMYVGGGEEGEGMIEIEVITCDGCGMSPIYSSRYSCNQV